MRLFDARETALARCPRGMSARYRQLDSLEAGFAILDRNSAGGANLVAVVEIDIVLHEDRVRAAAAQLQRECPWLRARIVCDGGDGGDGGALWFEEDDSVIAVRVCHGDADDAFDHELATPFAHDRGPLCRITAVKSAAGADALVVSLHHSICDGNTVQALIYRLLDLCHADAPRDLPARRADAFPALPLTVQSRPTWPLRKRAYAWYRLIRYAAFTRKGQLVRFERTEADPTRRHTTRHPWAFDADETAAIVEAARIEGASVTGALCAAALCTARDYHGGGTARAMRLRMTCNVSLWPLLQSACPAWPHLGNFVTMIQLGVRMRAAPSFWHVARVCTAAARDRPRETVRDVSLLVGNLVRPRAAALLAKATRDPRTCGRGAAVHVSNLGVIDDHSRPRHIRTFHAAMPQHAAGAMLWLSAATVRGRLHGTLLTVAPLISPDTSRTFVPALRTHLLAATKS